MLAVDADIGLRNLDILLGMSDMTALDFGDVLRGDADLEKAIVKSRDMENLCLLNAPYTLEESYDADFGGMMERAKELLISASSIAPQAWAGLLRWHHPPPTGQSWLRPLRKRVADAARAVERFDFYGVDDIALIVNRVRPRLAAKDQSPALTTQ